MLLGAIQLAAAQEGDERSSLGAFRLEGIGPFMSCAQMNDELAERGYFRYPRAGHVKDTMRIAVGNRSCDNDELVPVLWLERGTTRQACMALVEDKLGSARSCQEESRTAGRGGPTQKVTCHWGGAEAGVSIEAVSDHPHLPNREDSRECRIRMTYP